MRILFINHTQQQCGVYQYGKRISDILISDNRYSFFYYETDTYLEFIKKINELKPDVIVYNWHPSTMNWLTSEITRNLKNIKQLFVFHEIVFPSNFKNDGFIMSDLSEDEKNKKFSIPRPVFEKTFKKTENKIPTIGSFGFGFQNKGFERICQLVNSSFDNAIIHLHITNAFFGDRNGNISNKVIQQCKNIITKKNIELIVTTNFMSNDEILDFLNKNTVNMFLYDNMPGRGLSSTIDYAVSVDTPLIVNNSNMFRHLLSDRPEISIENKSINDIINMGVDSVQHFRKKWSNDNMRNKFYKILQKI
jgi:uncharacterized protein YvpB